MGEVIIINTIEQLKQLANKKGFIEVVIRDVNKKIVKMNKICVDGLMQNDLQNKEILENIFNAINKSNAINEKNLKLIANVANLQKIGLLLNGLSLCATCAGFAIIYGKLEKMSAEIGQQIDKVKNLIKQGQDVQVDYEFNKVLADHTDMLDCRRKQHPYSEEKMRDLVDREYNVLSLLINVFQKDISANNEATVFSVFSLLSMFTVSLKYFDEIYYTNNHEVLGENELWHTSHNKWLSIYETLSSQQFIEKLQDYAAFETNMNTLEIDAYCKSLTDQVLDQKEVIRDNQTLIAALGDVSLLNKFNEITNKEVKDMISDSYIENYGTNSEKELNKMLENALEQIALV